MRCIFIGTGTIGFGMTADIFSSMFITNVKLSLRHRCCKVLSTPEELWSRLSFVQSCWESSPTKANIGAGPTPRRSGPRCLYKTDGPSTSVILCTITSSTTPHIQAQVQAQLQSSCYHGTVTRITSLGLAAVSRKCALNGTLHGAPVHDRRRRRRLSRSPRPQSPISGMSLIHNDK